MIAINQHQVTIVEQYSKMTSHVIVLKTHTVLTYQIRVGCPKG